jgi:hypothetical protein
MSVPDDFDAFRQLTMTQISDAISQLGESPTSEALSAATNIVLSVIPLIENHYQQAMRSAQESTKERENVANLQLEHEKERSKLLRCVELWKENHRTEV